MRLFIIAVAVALLPSAVFGHSGRTDASGGHHDRKNGGYHYHNAGNRTTATSSPVREPELPPSFNPISPAPDSNANYAELPVRSRDSVVPNVAYRTEVRTSARTEARVESAATTSVESSVAVVNPTSFFFHMKSGSPRAVIDFSDNGKNWRAVRPANPDANFPKDLVVRIEPTKDLKERRTWIDATGRFSVVARFVEIENDVVSLRGLDDTERRLRLSLLSAADVKHVKKIQGR